MEGKTLICTNLQAMAGGSENPTTVTEEQEKQGSENRIRWCKSQKLNTKTSNNTKVCDENLKSEMQNDEMQLKYKIRITHFNKPIRVKSIKKEPNDLVAFNLTVLILLLCFALFSN